MEIILPIPGAATISPNFHTTIVSVNGEYRNLIVKGRALTFLVINETNCRPEMFSASLTQIIDLLCNSLHYPGIKKNLNTKKSLWRNNIKIDLKRVIKSSEYLDLVSKFEFYADQTNNRWAFLARA